MSRRIRAGIRPDGSVGLFIAPPGADAATAAAASLILNVTSKVSQLILMGRVTSSQVIALNQSRSPIVFVTSEFNWSSVIGHTLGPGPFRPSPPLGNGASSAAIINGNGASLSLSVGLPTSYQVYSQAFT
jgi:hypothetical protein